MLVVVHRVTIYPMTTPLTQAIAGILRAELARAQQTTTWFGSVIGRSQSHASQVLLGKKPLSTDELQLACMALGLRMSDVFRDAESRANGGDGPEKSSPVSDVQ